MRSPLALALSLAACGARTELTVVLPDAAPAVDVPLVVDAPVIVDTGVVADRPVTVDVPAAPCVWTPFVPRAITAGDRDRAPQSVRTLRDRLWVGFQSSNPDPPGNLARYVQVTDAAGEPLGAPSRVLPSPPELTTYGALSLWTDPVRGLHAAASWTAGVGCQAVLLDDNARPATDPVRLGDEDCAGVVRHPGGWSYFTRSPTSQFTRFHSLDAAGGVLSEPVLAPEANTTASARYVFDDAGFAFAWAGRPVAVSGIAVNRYDVLGRSAGATGRISPARAGALVQLLRMVGDGETLLVAWLEFTTDPAVSDLVIVRTDRTGAPMGVPRVLARLSVPGGRPAELGLAVARGVPALVYNPSPMTVDGTLRLMTLDPSTLAPASTVDIRTARFPHNLFLRDTSQGLVVVFGAIAPPVLTQVWTAAWRCIVPG